MRDWSDMFILALRGRLGVIMAIRLHLLSIALTILVFNVSSVTLKLLMVLAYVVFCVLTLKQLDRNKATIRFNSRANRQLAYPASAKVDKAQMAFSWSITMLFFVGPLALVLRQWVFTGPEEAVFAVVFYLGCLGAIDVMHRFVRTSE